MNKAPPDIWVRPSGHDASDVSTEPAAGFLHYTRAGPELTRLVDVTRALAETDGCCDATEMGVAIVRAALAYLLTRPEAEWGHWKT